MTLVLAFAAAGVALRPAVVSAAKPVASVPVVRVVPAPTATFPSLRGEADRAHAIVKRLAGQYRLLDGVTVKVGATPSGEQAVAYYMQSTIIVNPAHTAPLERILRHEIWHIIDWRDNGRIDWGEALPPASEADYLK